MSNTNAPVQGATLHTYLRLLKYLKPLAVPFVTSIVGLALFAATAPMLAKLMEMVIQAINTKDADARWLLPAGAIGIFIIRGVGSFLGNYYNAFVAARLVTNIRCEMFDHLTLMPEAYFQDRSAGQILQQLVGSVGMIATAITDGLKVIVREGMTISFLLVYIFYVNWQISLVFLLIAPLLLVIVQYTTSKFRDITRKTQVASGGFMQVINELIAGHQVMRIFGGTAYERNRHAMASEDVFRMMMKLRKVSSISTPVIQLLVALAIAGIIFILLMPATLAGHSAGELIGYLTAVGLLPKSMKQMGGLNIIIQQGIVGAEMAFGLLDAKTEENNGTYDPGVVRGDIAIQHVEFRYKPQQQLVLKDVSLNIPAGQMVALVGKSGSGKSTIATLLQRVYKVASGSITIDGININEYTLESLRRQMALVSQNLVLFNDTVANNIAYGSMRGASIDAIREAARKAEALEFIDKLPQGFNTKIGDNGLKLSGGQRQRIAIARAFLKDAPILILDEATSALDNESEQKIQKALDGIMQNRTTIVIAHRLSTVERADNIFVMSQGKIVESGTHSELLASGGAYKDLYTTKEL